MSVWLAALVLGLLTPLTPPPIEPVPAPAPVPEAVSAPVLLPVPTVHPRPEILYDTPNGPPGAKSVALTFDDGPDPLWTPQVLDLLARHHAVATFCLVGHAAHGREQLVARIVAAGMRLCDHSRTHDLRLGTRPIPQITDEIAGVKTQLAAIGGTGVDYFRAPGGNWSPDLVRIAVANGMQPLGWSVDARDWQRPGTAAIVATVKQQIHPHAIVLMHDGGGDRSQTVAALEQLLPWLTAQGYVFTVP